ncbi:MAG: retropepsin-like aspartic protease [Oceanicaulis sp.]
MLVTIAVAAAAAALAETDAAPRLEAWPAEAGRIEAWPQYDPVVEIIHHEGRILAPVHIEGVGERLFILDTAAGASLISSSLRADLDLAPGETETRRVRGATGVTRLDYVRLAGLRFGDVEARGLWTLVGDLEEFAPAGGREVAGILGVDILARRDLRLDLANGELTLRRPRVEPGGAPGVPFHSSAQAGFVQFTAELNGAPVAAVLDTGARSGTLNWAAAGLAGLAPGGRGVIDTGGRSAGVDGVGVARLEARVDGLCVGRACFNAAPVRIADLAVFSLVGADGGAGPSMLVGADLLEICAAEILYSQGVLRLCDA